MTGEDAGGSLPEVVVSAAFARFRAGASFEEIAKSVEGVGDVVTARRAVQEGIAACPAVLDEAASRIVALERLAELHRALWPKAVAGGVREIDRVLRIEEARLRLTSEPSRAANVISEAFEDSLKSLSVEESDGALVAACRQVARQIDYTVAHGTSADATRALYLLPHLMSGLRELGATPAARAALAAAAAEAEPPRREEPTDDLSEFKARRRT